LSQTGNLQAQHDARPAHAHLGGESLESLSIRRRPRLALVAVDDHDLSAIPPQGDRPLAEGVLAGTGLGVGEHLAKG
jgi:hypothetical protein